jgi:hypothetical protein
MALAARRRGFSVVLAALLVGGCDGVPEPAGRAIAVAGPAQFEATRNYWETLAREVEACAAWSAPSNPMQGPHTLLKTTLTRIRDMSTSGVDAEAIGAANALLHLRAQAREVVRDMLVSASADAGSRAAGGYQGGGAYQGGYSAGAGLVAGGLAAREIAADIEETRATLERAHTSLSARYGVTLRAIPFEDKGCFESRSLSTG